MRVKRITSKYGMRSKGMRYDVWIARWAVDCTLLDGQFSVAVFIHLLKTWIFHYGKTARCRATSCTAKSPICTVKSCVVLTLLYSKATKLCSTNYVNQLNKTRSSNFCPMEFTSLVINQLHLCKEFQNPNWFRIFLDGAMLACCTRMSDYVQNH